MKHCFIGPFPCAISHALRLLVPFQLFTTLLNRFTVCRRPQHPCRLTYGTRAQNGAREDSLGTRRSLLSQLFSCCPTSVCILWRICLYIYISDRVETVCELLLLPNNTASETFLHKSGAVRSVDWVFITGAPVWRWPGEYVTLDRTCYDLLFKQTVVAAIVTATFYGIPRGNVVITLCINSRIIMTIN